MGLIKPCEQFPNRLPECWMDPVRGDFGGGFQNKAPLAHQRVGDGEAFGRDDLIIVKKQIQIECSRSPVNKPDPTESLFDLKKKIEQRKRFQAGLKNADSVEKITLDDVAHRGVLSQRT